MKRNYKPILLMALVIGLMGMVGEMDRQADEALRKTEQTPLSTKEKALAEFYQKHGAPDPVSLAVATASLKRPRLAAAQAVVESNGNPKAIGKAGEKGTWQILEREWGVVPTDLRLQADQYEKIMESLIAEQRGRLREALSRYNSGHPNRSLTYSAKVMELVKTINL